MQKKTFVSEFLKETKGKDDVVWPFRTQKVCLRMMHNLWKQFCQIGFNTYNEGSVDWWKSPFTFEPLRVSRIQVVFMFNVFTIVQTSVLLLKACITSSPIESKSAEVSAQSSDAWMRLHQEKEIQFQFKETDSYFMRSRSTIFWN